MPTNREILKQIKTDYGLTSKKVSQMLMVSIHTVNSWLIEPGKSNHKPMQDRDIKFLNCLLKSRKKVTK